MSADYEEAARQGSTSVRVGSQIFGAREPKAKSPRGPGPEAPPESPAAETPS